MDIEEVVALLHDDSLIWSDEFEAIRIPLGNLLIYSQEVEHEELREAAAQIAESFIEPEVEVNLDEMERWLIDAGRAMGIIAGASRRERLAEQLKKLFRRF